MIKRSIALVIREPANGSRTVAEREPGPRWLLVRRPDDDADLPGIWGLPAGTLGPEETTEGLVRRIGRGKLGVDVEPGALVAAGSADRAAYRLDMELWTATITHGVPDVQGLPAQPGNETRYGAWKWDDPSALGEGAGEGSLCCRLGIIYSAA